MEEYTRHREEEKEILRMTEEHRQEMERENRKLNATDLARLQERVSTDLARLQERVCLLLWIALSRLNCSL